MILRFKVRLNRQRQNFVQVLHQLGHLRIFLRADLLSVELEAQVLFAWFWHAVGDDLRLDAGYQLAQISQTLLVRERAPIKRRLKSAQAQLPLLLGQSQQGSPVARLVPNPVVFGQDDGCARLGWGRRDR